MWFVGESRWRVHGSTPLTDRGSASGRVQNNTEFFNPLILPPSTRATHSPLDITESLPRPQDSHRHCSASQRTLSLSASLHYFLCRSLWLTLTASFSLANHPLCPTSISLSLCKRLIPHLSLWFSHNCPILWSPLPQITMKKICVIKWVYKKMSCTLGKTTYFYAKMMPPWNT